MQIEIITPDATLYSGEATYVFLPGSDGSLGVMNNHAPLISSLKKGTLRLVDKAGKEVTFDLNGGTVEVLNNKVVVLAE
ncbi:MAG: synthase subunit epsilon, partial [Bacteroidota bacterium]|jgi:F-type H+-transporting ATPase subunit epsilon